MQSMTKAQFVKKHGRSVIIPVRDKLPTVGARVIVVTDKFRCLGYRDEKGIWHYDKDSREIEGVIGWHGFLAA